IKCDQSQKNCKNCERVGTECPGYGSGPLHRSERAHLESRNSRDVTQAGIKRTRLFRSCKSCQKAKTKCSGLIPMCSRCADKNLMCSYESGKRGDSSESTSANDPIKPSATSYHGKHKLSTRSSGQEMHFSLKENPQHENSDWAEARSENEALCSTSFSWLSSLSLPSHEIIYKLVEAYFDNIYPLRCFGFIHKPSLIKKLDEGPNLDLNNNVLLLAICALGAKFYILNCIEGDNVTMSKQVLAAGSGWASQAQRLLFADLGKISIENLMAAVLLHDYQLRVGNYLASFMLTGMAARMVQALQINLEFSSDIFCVGPTSRLDATMRESRRRLLWSCFIMDSWVGSGVDQLTLLNENDIRVQLPCSERNFLQQVPCITETLTQGEVLRFVSLELRPVCAAANMGLNAYFIRICQIRKRVLRFIKCVDLNNSFQIPDPGFLAFDLEFKEWLDSLPSTLHLNSKTLYIRKESNQLAALFLLHCVYHVTICDLYRVGNLHLLPSLMRHRFPKEPSIQHQQFFARCREKCFAHAKEVANIFDLAVQHGRKVLSDTWFPTIAHESLKIMVCHIKTGYEEFNPEHDTLQGILPLLRANLKALGLMIPLFATA
ncbi:fungal-specific transcription factor domain-containing protein, partial [Halenospora varia]